MQGMDVWGMTWAGSFGVSGQGMYSFLSSLFSCLTLLFLTPLASTYLYMPLKSIRERKCKGWTCGMTWGLGFYDKVCMYSFLSSLFSCLTLFFLSSLASTYLYIPPTSSREFKRQRWTWSRSFGFQNLASLLFFFFIAFCCILQGFFSVSFSIYIPIYATQEHTRTQIQGMDVWGMTWAGSLGFQDKVCMYSFLSSLFSCLTLSFLSSLASTYLYMPLKSTRERKCRGWTCEEWHEQGVWGFRTRYVCTPFFLRFFPA